MAADRRRWADRRFVGAVVAVVTLLIVVAGPRPAIGQPFSAQIQRALNAFVGAVHTYTATQTFTDIVVNGTCTGAGCAGGGGAPTDATYITQTTNASLSAEQALSALATGLMFSTTTTGVVTTIAPTDDNLVVGSGATWALKALTDCTDTGGNHLNYATATNSFSCGTSGGSSGITIGTTTITGGATTQVLFNLAGVVSSDAGFTYVPGTDTLTIGTTAVSKTSNNIVLDGSNSPGIHFNGDSGDGYYVAKNYNAASDWVVYNVARSELAITVLGGATAAARRFSIPVVGVNIGANLTLSPTAPTVAACTSATVTAASTAFVWEITIGTSCTGVKTIVLTLPTAATAWNCSGWNTTNEDSNVLSLSAATTTTATLTNYARTTGLQADVTAGDKVSGNCTGR